MRDKLLNLAEIAVCNRGYGATSYGDLAKLAGIRKASIHHHFPVKADLGKALIQAHVEHRGVAVRQLADAARTGADALRGAIARYRDELGTGDSLGLLVALGAEGAALPRPMQRLLRTALSAEVEWLEEVFRRGRQDRSIAVPGEFAIEARAALAQLAGAQLLARADGDPATFDTAIAPLLARTTRH